MATLRAVARLRSSTALARPFRKRYHERNFPTGEPPLPIPLREYRMNAVLLSLALLAPAAQPDAKDAPNDVGVLPVGADGKPLNLDFETGTLKDWTAEGTAFKDQPVKGDTVRARRGDMRSRHQGEYWIGGYEKFGDKPQGTLTSVPFKVTHPWASFLIGGGPHTEETCVEIFHADRKYVLHRATGLEEEDMRREVVDLTPIKGAKVANNFGISPRCPWGLGGPGGQVRPRSGRPPVPAVQLIL
jgi:hypothetical protein